MKMTFGAKTFVVIVVFGISDAVNLRTVGRGRQEPDTNCGKGFENLVQGSKDYYRTAAVELFTHPMHTQDNATFETELECWFANMCTTKCGGLKSQADSRKDKLTDLCKSTGADWLKIWKEFSSDEIKWFKKSYPSEELEDGKSIFFKQAMETVKEVNKKELLCLTLFTIDDECVTSSYIKLGGK